MEDVKLDDKKERDRIQKSLNNNVLWMTQLDLVEDSTQWVWNVHMSL